MLAGVSSRGHGEPDEMFDVLESVDSSSHLQPTREMQLSEAWLM
jgi:hypothetical protein